MKRQTLSSARRVHPNSQKMDDDAETGALVKKEEENPLTATETFEKDLERIKENGKDIKGQNNRNFFKSIVERIENNVKVLAELRTEHSQLRDKLKELTDGRPVQNFDLHEEISKMTKQMLRGIRVKTKEELKERIYKYFDEVNEEPVIFHWKYNLDDIDVSEEVIVDTLPIKKSS